VPTTSQEVFRRALLDCCFSDAEFVTEVVIHREVGHAMFIQRQVMDDYAAVPPVIGCTCASCKLLETR
jgi:predicted Zn-dependent protease with MMP-like domain